MKSKFKKVLVDLFRQNSTPGGIALGLAVGAFIGILPLYGLHTLLVIVAALIVRPANKVAILLGTNVSLFPTVPFITWAGYEIGRLILWGKFEPLTGAYFKDISFQKIVSHYLPLFLGSVILGIICAGIVYLVSFLIIRKIEKRK